MKTDRLKHQRIIHKRHERGPSHKCEEQENTDRELKFGFLLRLL